MSHLNLNTATRTIVPVSALTVIKEMYRTASSELELVHVRDALGCLATHTPYLTESEVENVNTAFDAIDKGLRYPQWCEYEGRLAADAAAEPLLADDRFDPTAWTSETAEDYLHDGGYDLPESPLGWSWTTCSGCAVPVPVQDAPAVHHLCDECLDTRRNAA